MITLVLAGSAGHFRQTVRDLALDPNPNRTRYVHSVDQVRGLSSRSTEFVMGHCAERHPERREILEILRAYGIRPRRWVDCVSDAPSPQGDADRNAPDWAPRLERGRMPR